MAVVVTIATISVNYVLKGMAISSSADSDIKIFGLVLGFTLKLFAAKKHLAAKRMVGFFIRDYVS